jgi:pilus assembly protein FimV
MRASSTRGTDALKHRVSYFVALMAALTGAAAPSHALTLGDLRGSVVIGRSLDVSVPVTPAPGEDISASCLAAEVLFADALQIASLTVAAGTVPAVQVRIRTSALVDEPMVSVVLRSNCGAPTSRRYVMLSDFPAPDLPKADSAPAGHVTHASASVSVLPQQSPVSVDVAPSPAKAAAPAAHVVKPKPVVKKPVAPATPVKHAPPEAAVAKPVLKLDPQPVLPVQGDVPVPAALAASAPASAPSDEAVQQALRIQALQNDVKALKDLAAQNQASLLAFQSKLRQAEDERVPMSWFYLVAGLLGISLGALVWLLRKQKKAQKADWWQQPQNEASETLVIQPASTAQPAPPVSDVGKFVTTRVVPPSTVPPSLQTQPDLDLDIDLDSRSRPGHTPVPSDSQAVVPVDGFGVGHNINVETISDIRQQAEFFVSLGQTDRALNILRKQILESTEPNPLVYLDLLSLYHSEGLKSDFRELRAAFNQFFNAEVPDFPAFNLEGRDLLAYTEPLAVLARFWPNIEAIAFLEACIFHNDAAPMQLTFDLAAFRDLLMLHAVAEKVTSDSPWKTTSHGGLGLSTTTHAEMAELAMTLRGQFDESKAGTAPADALDTRSGGETAPFAPVAGGHALDFDLDAPIDTAIPASLKPPAPGGGAAVKSPFRNSFF